MKIRFERDWTWQVVVGSVEGRPEAVREFHDIDLRQIKNENSPMVEWIEELKHYLGEEVESVSRA